ncbi:hypothetical protein RJ639_035705 [Escallonia herrerae]|uniref:NAC domain-containing protein n=1 Tax=Escallonia herrerae TaxID=1293975 RepID=A0AA88WUI9_9ASTE|nr:hypothetical protein RJ639_035705 [Escallonia herrerae]
MVSRAAWLIDSRAIAKKVKNATFPSAYQIKDYGANRECPNCHYLINNSDVSHEWPGLPAGVKFDPSDVELLEHLAAKCGVGDSKQHIVIDEFIVTLEGDAGICCSHPEDLPGAKNDGSSVHYFHRTRNAYATGQRKRRKIQGQNSFTKEHVRWHKTGKTKPIMEDGVQRGYKKIMVLYRTSGSGSKPDKSNWVMHQYHLGTHEDEKEGEYVVSKVFYQPQKQSDRKDNHLMAEDFDMGMIKTSPRTPKTYTPHTPQPENFVSCDDVTNDYLLESPTQEMEFVKEISHPSSSHAQLKDDMDPSCWLAGESQAIDAHGDDELLRCGEGLDSFAYLSDSGLTPGTSTSARDKTNDVLGGNRNGSCGIADFENLDVSFISCSSSVSLHAPFHVPLLFLVDFTFPHLSLQDLQFDSQYVNDWTILL